MEQPGIKARTKVKLEPRLRVLTWAVSEYAEAFGAGRECLDSIKKGVYERQIIERIILYYYHHNSFVGCVTLTIDWDLHQMLMSDENGNQIQIREGESILHQLDESTEIIKNHVSRMRDEFHVTRIETAYQYRQEYNRAEKLDEARRFLGHVCQPPDERQTTQNTPQFKTLHRLILNKLKELEVTVES